MIAWILRPRIAERRVDIDTVAEAIPHPEHRVVLGVKMEFMLPGDTAAVRFVSHDPLLGELGETWFHQD